jgi:hypothetical protein
VGVISFKNLQTIPWKNGSGVTRELYRYPKDSSFENLFWRVSVADVEKCSDFSVFPGIDRIITLLHGQSMELRNNGEVITSLLPFEPHFFHGEDHITARAFGDNCQDFNLMLRRGVASGNIQVLHYGDHSLQQGAALLFCVQGLWKIVKNNDVSILECGQTLIFEDEPSLTLLHSLIVGSMILSVKIYL